MHKNKPDRHSTEPRAQARGQGELASGATWSPSGAERRAQPRIPLRIFCEISDGTIIHLTHSCDGSLRGFSAEPLDGLRLGRLYWALLHDGIDRIAARVRLVRVESARQGFAIEEIADAQRRAFRRLLLRHAYQHSPELGQALSDQLQEQP
jgi:hypothetical protein